MLKSKFALSFFCSAALFALPLSANAQQLISANTTITDLNEFSANYTQDFKIDGATTVLTIRQNTDGEYAGTISGNGELKKTGDANLVFEGSLGTFDGFISVSEGALTLSDRA